MKLITMLSGTEEIDSVQKRVIWIQMNGGSELENALLQLQTVNLQKHIRQYRLLVMKPGHVKGHFYDVVFNGWFHALIQMSPNELEIIAYTLRSILNFDSSFQVSSVYEMTFPDVIKPTTIINNRATRVTSAVSVIYANEEATEDWSHPPETLEEAKQRTLEIYTNNECYNCNLLYNNSNGKK